MRKNIFKIKYLDLDYKYFRSPPYAFMFVYIYIIYLLKLLYI